jgi:hypothetical protein
MTTDTLTDEQREMLVMLLREVESADDPEKAVWLGPNDRSEVSNIRETIEAQA